MQPRLLAILITFLPLIAGNGAYIMSAYSEFVPWCIPYLDGCTTVSRAGRSGDAIFLFRAIMIVYGVLLIWFWIYSQQWLNLLAKREKNTAGIILWLGIVAALFLIIYIDYLGTTGEVNRFMRRFGIMIYFTFTPLAQLMMLKKHYDLVYENPDLGINKKILRFQLIVLLLMLVIGVISLVLGLTNTKSYESENIVEWNFSLLLSLYFSGMIFLWKDFNYFLKINK
ncbi:MAG: hypothetical protein ACN4GM_14215 [Gammaproteobacteria bacterium]